MGNELNGTQSVEGFDKVQEEYEGTAAANTAVYVAGAEEDLWADPKSEFLSCVAASEVYEKLGLKGFVSDEKLPEAEAVYQNGEIAYHLRHGIHYLSRKDWNLFMDYLKKL
mgnify:CR=1 FL=1